MLTTLAGLYAMCGDFVPARELWDAVSPFTTSSACAIAAQCGASWRPRSIFSTEIPRPRSTQLKAGTMRSRRWAIRERAPPWPHISLMRCAPPAGRRGHAIQQDREGAHRKRRSRHAGAVARCPGKGVRPRGESDQAGRLASQAASSRRRPTGSTCGRRHSCPLPRQPGTPPSSSVLASATSRRATSPRPPV